MNGLHYHRLTARLTLKQLAELEGITTEEFIHRYQERKS